MRWITNAYDPSKPGAWDIVFLMPGQTYREAEESQKEFLLNKIIGKPKATDTYTVEQLEARNVVGVYVND